MNLKESIVRDWRNLYRKQLHDKVKLAKPGEEVEVTSIEMKKQGRPPLLGKNMDNHLQQLITAMRSRGTPIGNNIVCAVARGILLKHGKLSVEVRAGKFLNKEWARSVLHRMGFTKRRACSKSKTLPQDVSEIQRLYLMAAIQMEDIPKDLVFNWDQTAMKIVPWAMERKGIKHVKIAALNDKRLIIAVFRCSVRKILSNTAYLQRDYIKMPTKECQLSKGLGYHMYQKPLVERIYIN